MYTYIYMNLHEFVRASVIIILCTHTHTHTHLHEFVRASFPVFSQAKEKKFSEVSAFKKRGGGLKKNSEVSALVYN